MEKSLPDIDGYDESRFGLKQYLRDLADDLFAFDAYRQYQDEILYETLQAFYVDGYKNVIIEGPTGIGKSPLNVAVARVNCHISNRIGKIESHFGVAIDGVENGKSFYTTPQKSLRSQLADDDDLQDYVSQLKARADYICGATGSNCADCPVRSSTETSCMQEEACTYWSAKMDAIDSDISALTFAMLIVDNYLPPMGPEGNRVSFEKRDLVINDEGHNSEGQSASLFAGFTLSPWSLPEQVWQGAGEQVSQRDDRLEDVLEAVQAIADRAEKFAMQYDGMEQYQQQVDNCENYARKIDYAIETHLSGDGWVVNIDEISKPGAKGTTNSIEVKPVRVDEFLQEFVWSRGRRRLLTSATIPFRGEIDKWADRIGLPGDVKFISKSTPFPKSHRQIHLNTVVGEMSGRDEDLNWTEAMAKIREIASHHQGEKGVIHSVSYSRAERVADSLASDNVLLDDDEHETDAMLTRWQNSNKDIFISPTVTEGVDLHTDKARWQVLLKAPFAYAGDSRVDYLLNEEHEWGWYYEETAIDIIQAVGRAVRGPEPKEAATFYVIDSKFNDVMDRIEPPNYIRNALQDDAPDFWDDPDKAPWRQQ